MWTIKTITADEDGATLPAFAMMLPALVFLTLGTIEISTIIFDWHRASEATRRGARHIAISEPIADMSSFVRGSTVSCQGTVADTVSCTGSTVTNAVTFTDMLSQMQQIQPDIQSEHVSIVYSDSGLGDPSTPGGILPMITVQVSNLERPLMAIGGFMGMPASFSYPPFLTNQIANGIGETE